MEKQKSVSYKSEFNLLSNHLISFFEHKIYFHMFIRGGILYDP